MIRIVVEPSQIQGHECMLTPPQQHYLFRVMRVRPGQLVEALVSGARLYECKVEPDSQTLTIQNVDEVHVPIAITLAQALIKRDLFAQIVEKGTEAGISRFIPVVSERSIVRDVSPAKQQRWQIIAQEATEQSRQTRVPQIEPVTSFKALPTMPGHVKCVLHPEGPNILEWLLEERPHGSEWMLVAGPEGGLSDSEVAMLQEAQYVAVSLGPFIYRAENAGVIAAGILTAWASSRLSSVGDLF
ncbi:16S rRNA (uracil(1498)-N(3))-methyltransferase [Sulfobacillus sp. hq2]|uniref:RsmE family RNA methyltransferase n=1 Tax=Sulfobacillus TaxID=28033 RepID=UPI000CD15C0A|nr:RsmE family RNA methyltransferase [Sulfobacillus sp. hq2]POB11715.1 16S rRNA methyltransferase [Sulfobacillus sp. hq2]